MQVERTKKSKYLFEVGLDEDELLALMQLDQQILKGLLYRCSRIFQKQIIDREGISIFLNNYRMIMESHSVFRANAFSVNLCLHFALLYSQFLLLQNRQGEAKAVLKQTQSYIEIQGIDSMLISVCMNNLALLYSKQGKIYKALAVALKAVNLVQEHLQGLKSSKNRSKLIQDVIVFVNVLIVTQNVLKKIILTNNKTFFKSLFKIVNRLGFSFAQKYLGSQSLFTKKFFLSQDSVLLPVYQEQSIVQQYNQFQVRIAQQLDNIYKVLADLNLQPEVYYIKEHSILSKKSQASSSIHIDEPTPPPQVEFNVRYADSFQCHGWNVSVSIYREATDLQLANYSLEYIGNLRFKIQKERQIKIQKIQEEKFIKIINCLNINDVMPFQHDIKIMNSLDFFKKIFIHFITVAQGELRILPHSEPVIAPFEKKFCKQTSLVFVNHIAYRKFRIGICPCEGTNTIYLEVDFKNKEIYKMMNLVELQSDAFQKLFKRYHTSQQLQHVKIKLGSFKKIKIIKPQQFKNNIIKIIDRFENFLNDDDIDAFDDIITSTENSDEAQKHYYIYNEQNKQKGVFYEFRYRSNANYIQILLKNTYKTHVPNGQAQAKGNYVISPQHFLKNFGLVLKPAKKWLPVFYSLLAQKYTLKVFDHPIDQMQQDRFEQNAITQLNLTSKFFRRKMILFDEYMLPLTIQLIAVTTDKPIGLKVSVYEPIKSIYSSLFIYVNADSWERIPVNQFTDNSHLDNDDLQAEKFNYNFRKDYFLAEWLADEGFQKIYSKLTIVNRSLEVKGLTGKFVRIEEFF